ncbi:MAG: hypothetical protein HUJ77_07310 [Clostridium sp.]|uniref:hypothetical protein n=1 Tax=Clostridium sp. TaxID=1506 RepID=UPI0025C31429|nr:hypothetical protein [Clostridium sp.]MCF0148190.1 hypothetical protein [Clostridium sp.]
MGTSYGYNAENFEEILSRLGNDETELASNASYVDSENGLDDFNFADLESLNYEELNSRDNNGCRNSNDIDATNLGLGRNDDYSYRNSRGSFRNNNNSCEDNNDSCGVLNARECYEKGLREGLEQGFIRGFSRGKQQGREAGLREGFNAGLERGLSRSEELARAAYQKGFRCGYQKGFKCGYQKGYKDGFNAGLERGTREGFNNGFRTGYNKALRDVIRAVNNLSCNANNTGTVSNENANSCWRNCQ